MVKRRRHIVQSEMDWLYENGYAIRVSWIGPVEGYEYKLHKMGQEPVLAFRKSSVACYNAAKKISAGKKVSVAWGW